MLDLPLTPLILNSVQQLLHACLHPLPHWSSVEPPERTRVVEVHLACGTQLFTQHGRPYPASGVEKAASAAQCQRRHLLFLPPSNNPRTHFTPHPGSRRKHFLPCSVAPLDKSLTHPITMTLGRRPQLPELDWTKDTPQPRWQGTMPWRTFETDRTQVGQLGDSGSRPQGQSDPSTISSLAPRKHPLVRTVLGQLAGATASWH